MYDIHVGTLLKDVGYYGLRFLSISVMSFQKNWMDGGWVEEFYLSFSGNCLTLQTISVQ